MKKLFLLTKTLLVAALFGVGTSAWAQDLPTPVYFNDFNTGNGTTAPTGLTIHGGGTFVDEGDANFGKVFQNGGGAQRTHYLQLPADVLSHSATSKKMTIGFWVNKGNAGASSSYQWAPLFTAYSDAPVNNQNTSPMFACQYRGVLQVNNNGWCDYVDCQNTNSTNAVYNGDYDWLADAKWHYYTIVFDGEIASIYFDGVLKNQWNAAKPYWKLKESPYTIVDSEPSNSGDYDYCQTSQNGLYTNGDNLDYVCLGGNQAWSWGDNDAAFKFDDFAVYDNALTTEQISKIMECKTSTKTKVTYDFAELINSKVSRGSQLAFDFSENYLTTVDSKTVYVFNNFTDRNFYNSFAGETNLTMRRGNDSKTDFASNGIYNGGGRKERFISIRNLNVGDKITFYGTSNGVFFRSTNVTTPVSKGSAVEMGVEYVIASGTQIDLQLGTSSINTNYYIGKIEISSPYDAVSNPSIAETDVEGTAKIVTITNGTSSHSNIVTTYYTIDGTAPSASNNAGSFTSATQNVTISSDATVKAISISSDATESYIVSLEVEAGVKTPLNMPTASLTGMAATDGLYYPVYTFNSDNSDIAGTPIPDSYAYTFTPTVGEEENGTLTDAKFTFTKPGTLEIVATINHVSFKNSEAKSVTVSSNYLRTQFVDVKNLYDLTGKSATNGFYGGLEYDLIANTTFSRNGDSYGAVYRGYHNTTYNSYYGRNQAFTATCTGLTEDMVVVFADKDGNNYTAVTNTNPSITVAKDATLKYYSLYVLPTVTKTVSVGDASLATYTSDMSLDYSTVSTSLIPYKATVDGSTITLTKATVVPAGEGVLLRSVSGEAVNNVAVPVASYSAWAAADNAFVGTIKDITVYQTEGNTTNYVLSKEDEAVGFFKASSEGTSVGANKAYLPVTTTSGARLAVVFEDETTGIADVNAHEGEKSSDIYTLSGMRVAAPQKGLYIMNGKKVIIK